MNEDKEKQLLALLSDKMNLLETKEETIDRLSMELLGATQRETKIKARLNELLKRQQKYKILQGEIKEGGNLYELMLQKLLDREDKLATLSKKYNALEKSLELQRMKVKALMAKSENNIYMREEPGESDQKLMEKLARKQQSNHK